VLAYGYMHLCILFIKVKVMFSVKAQWITCLDSNFLSKIFRPTVQSRSAGMYMLNLSSSLFLAYNLPCTTVKCQGLKQCAQRETGSK